MDTLTSTPAVEQLIEIEISERRDRLVFIYTR
jgi:hypothetical protein